MELRSDPITRSWVLVGHQEQTSMPADGCPLCPGRAADSRALLKLPSSGTGQICVIPHFRALYRIEGDVERRPDGIYDRMRSVGAHEIIIESPDHSQSLACLSDDQIERVLEAYALRVLDLKRDPRFKYITVFRNHGLQAGAEWGHPYSEVTATSFCRDEFFMSCGRHVIGTRRRNGVYFATSCARKRSRRDASLTWRAIIWLSALMPLVFPSNFG